MARQHLYTRLARRGWPVVYSTGPQSLWERHSEKWRRGGLLPTFDRVEAGDGAVVMVDRPGKGLPLRNHERSEEHTSEFQSLMRISYAAFCLKKTHKYTNYTKPHKRITIPNITLK